MSVKSDRSEQQVAATNVLIVEDDPLIATYIDEVLQESGFHVVGVASTGSEALSVIEETPADLALIDIRLSGPMDGIEVAQIILDQFGIRTIFLSGLYDDETLDRAKMVNPCGFLHKPFRPSQVYNELDRARRELINVPKQPRRVSR